MARARGGGAGARGGGPPVEGGGRDAPPAADPLRRFKGNSYRAAPALGSLRSLQRYTPPSLAAPRLGCCELAEFPVAAGGGGEQRLGVVVLGRAEHLLG